MKLSIALLPIIGVTLLSSCSKLEATCSGEDSLKLATQIISEDAEKYLTEQKRDDGSIIFAPASVRATLSKVSITIENIRTAKQDPNSTKVFCEGSLKISPSPEILKQADEARKESNLITISDEAKNQSFEQSANAFVKAIEYNVQPTDDGKNVFVEVDSPRTFSVVLGEMVGFSILGPMIKNQKIERMQAEAAQKQQAEEQQMESERLLNEQKQAQLEANLAMAQSENTLANQAINELWKNYPVDAKKLMLEAQRAWVKKKELDCKVEAASSSTDSNEKEIVRLNCDTRATKSRVYELQNAQ